MMKSMAISQVPKITDTTSDRIEKYYDICWSRRFETGHNPVSRAIHLGYYTGGDTNSETAKLALNDLIAARLRLVPGRHLEVVDAGCGVGGTCVYLARQFPNLHVTGINLSEKQLLLAREYAQREQVASRTGFVLADYCDSGLPAASADGVYAIESVCHAESKESFYAEAYRLLRPGGILVIADYVETALLASPGENRDYAAFCDGWEVHRYLKAPTAALATAGFDPVQEENITEQVYPGIVRSHDNSLHNLHSPGGPGEETMQNHLKACIALKHLVDRREIAYSVLTAVKP